MASWAVDEPLVDVTEVQNLAATLLSIGLISAVPNVACTGADGATSKVVDTMAANVIKPTTARAGRLFFMSDNVTAGQIYVNR
jgi:hypothetical protein